MKYIGLFLSVFYAAKGVLLLTKRVIPAKVQNYLLEPELGEWCVRGAISRLMLALAFFFIVFICHYIFKAVFVCIGFINCIQHYYTGESQY